MKKSGLVDKQLEILSIGPGRLVSFYKGYIVNGYRFHTTDRDSRRNTQNSGVFVNADTHSFAGAKDKRPVTGSVEYYGVLNDIVELHYLGSNRVVLFKCDWWDVYSRDGIKKDEWGYTSVNVLRKLGTNEPFILSTQAKQAFYVQDNLNNNWRDPTKQNKGDWRVVLKCSPRDLYDVGSVVQAIEPTLDEDATFMTEATHPVDNWFRNEIEGVEVVVPEGDEVVVGDTDLNDDVREDSDWEEEVISYSDDDL